MLGSAIDTVTYWMPPSDHSMLTDHLDAGWEDFESEKFGDAEAHFTAALDLHADDVTCLYSRARVRNRLDDLPGALADISRAIELVLDPDYYEFRSVIHARLGNEKQAEADRRMANALRARTGTQPSP